MQRAELQIESARIGIDQTRQQIASEVRAAHQNYLTSFEQLIASTAQVEASLMALESTQERYDAGVATLLEYYTGELDTKTQALL